MDSEEYHQFWISWTNDTISGGTGPLYDNELVVYKHNETLPSPMHTAFSTWESASGEWKVLQIRGKFCLVELYSVISNDI